MTQDPGLADDRWCFACGPHNPIGLRLDFELDAAGALTATFVPRKEHQGYLGRVHGGLLGVFADELMVRLLYMLGVPAVSAELKLRLHRPAPVGEPVRGRGWIAAQRGRIFETAAELRGADGELYASAEARCVRVAR